MHSLTKDFAITALIIIFGHWIYGVADIVAYDFFVEIFIEKKFTILAIGIFGSTAMVFFAAMFQSLETTQVTFVISKLFARLYQFTITFFSILNIIFYASLGINFFRSGGYDIFVVLFLTLGASCWALRMIDFNYHTKNILLPVGLITFMSAMVVEVVWPFFGF